MFIAIMLQVLFPSVKWYTYILYLMKKEVPAAL